MKFFQSHPTHPPSTRGSESLQAARCPRRCLVNVDLWGAVLMSSAGFTTIYQWNAMDSRVNTLDGSYEWSASLSYDFVFVMVAFSEMQCWLIVDIQSDLIFHTFSTSLWPCRGSIDADSHPIKNIVHGIPGKATTFWVEVEKQWGNPEAMSVVRHSTPSIGRQTL